MTLQSHCCKQETGKGGIKEQKGALHVLSNLLGSHVELGSSRNEDDKGQYFSVLRSGRMKHNKRVGRTRG